MPTPSALTNDQKGYLRSDRYQARAYVALNPNAVVATARVNQAIFGASVAQLTFDNGSGTGSVLVGQTVYVSASNDITQAYFRGRVRKAISGATLFINETSTVFNDNDYIFIINDVALHNKLPRGNDFIDYDITFRQGLPIAFGLQSAYVITLDDTPEASLSLAPNAFATASGASISSWLWSAPSATFTAGNSATQNVTLEWDTAGVYWVRLTVTDSGARSNFITFPVFVCSSDYSDAFIKTGIEDISINANDAGYQCSLTAFDGVESVLNNTLAVVFSVEKIGTSTTPIVSNVNFIGRLRQNTIATEANEQYVNTQDTAITIEDIASQMARCPIVTWSWTDKASPTVWGDIASLTLWRAIASMATDFSTLSNVASIRFDSTADTYRIYALNQNDSALYDGMISFSDAINARPTYTPQNEIFIYRSARFLTNAERNALTTVMDYTPQDMLGFDIDNDPAKLVGNQFSNGGSYNTFSQDVDLFEAIAPAVAPAEGVGQSETTNQVLTANNAIADSQVELGQRVANDFAQRNPITKINASLHDGFHFIQPNNFQWYTFTITADDNNRGLEFTTSDRWLCESVNARYDGNIGAWDVSAEFAIETSGGQYQVVVNVAPNEEPFYFAPYPIDNAYPNFPDENPFYPDENPDEDEVPPIEPKDKQPINNPVTEPVNTEIKGGDVVAVWNSAGVWVTTNFTKTNNPTWTQVYSGAGITDFRFAPLGNGAYVLSNDGADSFVWRTTNIFATSPSWAGTSLTGVYRQIRTTDTAGELFCLSEVLGEWAEEFDFVVDEFASNFTIVPPSVNIVSPVYTAGLGYNGGIHQPNLTRYNSVRIDTDVFADSFITSFTIFYTLAPTTNGVFNDTSLQYQSGLNGAFTGFTTVGLGVAPVSSSYTANINLTRDVIVFQINGSRANAPTNPDGNSIISKIIIRGTGVNPFGGTSTYNTVYSTDNGATFGAPVAIGDSPSAIGGIDTQRIGNLVFVGDDEKIRQATNGGAYSDTTNGGTTGTYAQMIRTYGQTGTKLIFGTASAISGDTLWRLDGGATAITPNDGVNDGLVVSANCLDMWITSDNDIVGVFNFGGTYRLGKSSDAGNSWSFVTTNITSDSKYIRVRQSDTLRKQVYSIRADATIYSNDGGATTQLKSTPSPSLIGIEVKS